MIGAKEALKISRENDKVLLELPLIEDAIRVAANQGKTAITYPVSKVDKCDIGRLVATIKEFGYKCSRMIENSKSLQIDWGE